MNARGGTWTIVQINQLRPQGFDTNDHRLWALNNLQGGFLPTGTCTGKGRTDADRPNSPARKRPVFRTGRRTIQQSVGTLASFPGGISQRRQPPVRRIDDLRGMKTRHRHFVPKTVSPERVVGIRSFFTRRSNGGFGAKVELFFLRSNLELVPV